MSKESEKIELRFESEAIAITKNYLKNINSKQISSHSKYLKIETSF